MYIDKIARFARFVKLRRLGFAALVAMCFDLSFHLRYTGPVYT